MSYATTWMKLEGILLGEREICHRKTNTARFQL